MSILVNIDNGGTFTDVCVSDGDRVVHSKSPTTPYDLTRCVVDVLKRASVELYGAEDLPKLLQRTSRLRYSTTSGTNAVVERKGSTVGLIVEDGEERTVYGAIEAFAGKGGLWDAMVPNPPRAIDVRGDAGPDANAVGKVVNELLALGAPRIVVALRSAQAERLVKDIILDRYPRHLLGAVPVLFAHELSNDPNDARRTVTAVVNSYLHPGMEHFLYAAEDQLKNNHLGSPLLIFSNDGDSRRVAKTTAVKTYGSGPRGGLEGALAFARLYGCKTLAGMDIGGTTTDLCVVSEGRAPLLAYGHADDLPLSFATGDLESYGLGGSSVFRVAEGEIVIGPDSVGAAPGPACFQRGGTEATITDALLVAGVLDADLYLGGDLRLDVERAKAAILERVAEPLGIDLRAAVQRMSLAYEQNIAHVILESLRHHGAKPADTTLLAFGGAGPLSACGIAEHSGIKRIIVPALAAVFSAYGIGFSDLGHRYQADIAGAGADLEQLADDLRSRAERDMYGEGLASADYRVEVSIWGRSGDREVVTPQNGRDLATLATNLASEGLCDLRLQVRAVHDLPKMQLVPDEPVGEATWAAAATVEIDLGNAGTTPVPAVDRDALAPGAQGDGPVLIRDRYLTCLVTPGWRFRVTANRDLVLEAR